VSNKKRIIVVGGGTSGLVSAHNLSQDYDVLVLERSKRSSYPIWFKIPLLIGLLFQSNKQKYVRKLDIKLNNRNIPFFQSEVLGGASIINGCVHVFGVRKHWIEFTNKLKINLREIENNYHDLYSTNHLDTRKINIKDVCPDEIDRAFFEALSEKNFKTTDMTYADEEGFGVVSNTVGRFFRTSVMNLINRNKFKIKLNKNVEGFVYSKDKIIGVKTQDETFHADYILINAGVIDTVKLFLKEKKNLMKITKNNHSLESIGHGVKDHTNLRINVRATRNIGSLNEINNSFPKKFILLLRHILGIPTLMRGTGATSAIHLDLDNDGVVDTRIQLLRFSENDRAGSDGSLFDSSNPGFSFSITQINPSSSGQINSNEVNPRYLHSKKDMKILVKAVSFCLNLLESRHLKKYVLKIENDDLIRSDVEKYISNNFYSGYHLIGGLSMLVDEKLRFKGLKNLFISDASIFDKHLASNIHASVVLVSDSFSKNFFDWFDS